MNDANVLNFPGAGNVPSVDQAPRESVEAQVARLAAELAVTTEELSLRVANDSGRLVTSLQIKGYTQRLARTRALLAQLEVAVGGMEPSHPVSQ